MKGTLKKIVLWVITVFCLLATLVYMPSVSSILFLVIGIGCIPLKIMSKVWEKIPQKFRFVKPILLAVIFFVACVNAPISTPATTETQVASEITAEEMSDATVSTEKDNVGTVLKESEQKQETQEEKQESATAPTAEIEQTKSETKTEKQTDTKEETKSTQVSVKNSEPVKTDPVPATSTPAFDIKTIGAYSGKPYVTVNGNKPYFTDDDIKGAAFSYESYSSLDGKGRCGVCVASVGQDIMPTEERGEIGQIKPSGWNQAKYPGVVDGNYLYNRCHLIGYQLTGENANEKNLITGTRAMNVDGMLPFENMVADYVKETGNHVLYRVTPIFEGSNPLASGVLMEAESVEDNGADILFCVFCYNAQPGITIDYSTGASALSGETAATEEKNTPKPVTPSDNSSQKQTEVEKTPEPQPQPAPAPSGGSYAVNAKNGKIHIVGGCSATGTGDKAMTNPVYFNSYEEAEAYSKQIKPNEEKRQCGNCW